MDSKKEKFNNIVSTAFNRIKNSSDNLYSMPTKDYDINYTSSSITSGNNTNIEISSNEKWGTSFVDSSIFSHIDPITGVGNTGGWVPYTQKIYTTGNNINPLVVDENDNDIILSDKDGEIRVKEKIRELESSLNKYVHNKVDKDLVNGKLPYNIKVDLNKTLYYEFAVAGYTSDRIKIIPNKEGIEIKLFEDSPDDFIGDLFEYINKGLKLDNQSEFIYIDGSQYDLDSIKTTLSNGILTLIVKYKPKKELKIEEINS
jgi:HSP20 family molecular chaperone IbpA